MRKLLSLAVHYWKALALAFGIVTFLSTMGPMVDLIREVSVSGIEVTEQRPVLTRTWAAGLLTLSFLLLASLAATFTLFLEKESQRRKSGELASKSLAGMMRAATRIVNHFYPTLEHPPYAVDEVSISRTVHANGDNEVKARLLVRACSQPLHFWRISLVAESEAPGVEFLDEVDFKITDNSAGEPLTYLVTKNDIHSKEISAFFLPFLLPDQEAHEIVYTYRWPGMSRKLLVRGGEVFNWTARSQGVIHRVEYCLYFDPELHRSHGLLCEVTGAKIPGAVLKEASSDAGWRGWRYEARAVPASSNLDCRIEVRTRR
ncbi:MAG TPA: hypothetical protein VF789_34720 [Thermoanaerobaculia bacterium]